ncbi:CRISPR-associated helicase Cas3' [Longispora sp. K20-0274]
MWGKSRGLEDSWLPLWRHLADSWAVAGRLWDEWLPAPVKRAISAGLPGGDSDGRLLLSWLAGVHDIGKATPAFAFQVQPLADRMRLCGLSFDSRVEADRRLAPHATAGQAILGEWLVRDFGWSWADSLPFTVVVGGHHGIPPRDRDLVAVRERRFLTGDEEWRNVQEELLAWMTDVAGVGDRLRDWGNVALGQQAQVLLTGAVVVSDWIASNEEFFPVDCSTDPNRLDWAWGELDLPSPWRAVPEAVHDEDLVAKRFGLPSGTVAYPVQRAAMETARQLPEGGIMIVEAPMGDGKTEAALAAVEILAARFGAGGCFMALPTRATSDAMLVRGLDWLDRLPDADEEPGARDVVLAHGKATFNPDYESLLYRGRTSAIGMDEGPGVELAVHRWLASRKKVLLSSFVIGTIDQLLFLTLKSRCVVLRHLGLAGKVVVIDEAHAYDVHMSQYLDRALEWLGAYGVPVVVLSATLPARRRKEMLAAHDTGRLGRARRTPVDPYVGLDGDIGYPVIISSGIDRVPTVRTSATSGRDVTASVTTMPDGVEELANLLRAELVDGGCVLVVRNTVARVQETATELRRLLGPEVPVTVAHSRFMALDRAAKDRWLRDTFGPKGERPSCHVVVASQVAEQSLDVDFDLLVTDLAPVDLVLQRMGRLHRHQRVRPARLTRPRCVITGADWSTTPPAPVPGSTAVYGQWALLRSAAVLWPHVEEGKPVRLPADIPRLVQAAYGDGIVGPPAWNAAIERAREVADDKHDRQRQAADVFRIGQVAPAGEPLLNWLHGSIGDADKGSDDAKGRGHVRADSTESLEVILLIRRDGQLYTPDWLQRDAGREVPTHCEPDWRLAKAVARCTLPLPQTMTHGGSIDRVITELEHRNNLVAWRPSSWLGGELVLDMDDDLSAHIAGFDLRYHPQDGLTVAKRV